MTQKEKYEHDINNYTGKDLPRESFSKMYDDCNYENDTKPDVSALFAAFAPALLKIAERITKNNVKHNGKRGRLGGRTSVNKWKQSADRHVLSRYYPQDEDKIDHLTAAIFNLLGELTEELKKNG